MTLYFVGTSEKVTFHAFSWEYYSVTNSFSSVTY